MNLFENYVDNGLTFARKKCVQAMQQVFHVKRTKKTSTHFNSVLRVLPSWGTKREDPVKRGCTY